MVGRFRYNQNPLTPALSPNGGEGEEAVFGCGYLSESLPFRAMALPGFNLTGTTF
jgi:hypothetical protein